jgi:hypothetical protein
MSDKLTWVWVITSDEDGNVLYVTNTRESANRLIIEDYYSIKIDETEHESNGDKYLGFTTIEYSHFEDDLYGYYTFESNYDTSPDSQPKEQRYNLFSKFIDYGK